MVIVELIDQIEIQLTDIRADVEKFDIKGNNAAGTRIRKAMQNVKAIAQQIRTVVSEIKNERKGG